MKTIAEIEELVKGNQIDAAIAGLLDILSAQPENAEAKMMLGTCYQMSGDECGCLRIYEEVRPQMELREAAGEISEAVLFWRKYRSLVAALLVVGVIPFCPAAETTAADIFSATGQVERAVHCTNAVCAVTAEQFKNLPRGVQSVKYDGRGAISTLVVVGKRPIPNAFRKNPGRAAEYGGDRARGEAQFELARFLSTKCKWSKTSDGRIAVKEESASATDAQGNETSAESSLFTETEMTKEQKAQSAQACVSGIQVLWEGLNDSGEYAWVGVWNARSLKAIKPPSERPQKYTKYGAHPYAPAYGVPRREVPMIFGFDDED